MVTEWFCYVRRKIRSQVLCLEGRKIGIVLVPISHERNPLISSDYPLNEFDRRPLAFPRLVLSAAVRRRYAALRGPDCWQRLKNPRQRDLQSVRSVQDRLDDVGREQCETQDARHVGGRDALARGQFGDRRELPEL